MIATAYPIPSRLEWLQRRADERHAPIFLDAEQIKRWRAEDAAKGVHWHG